MTYPFLAAVEEYMGIPASNEGLAREALSADRDQMVVALSGSRDRGSTEWKNTQRLLQRWGMFFSGGKGQKRNPAKMDGSTRKKVQRALHAIRTPANIHFEGTVIVSRKPHYVKRDIPLQHLDLNNIIKLSHVGGEHTPIAVFLSNPRRDMADPSPKESADRVLAGIYFEEPDTAITVGMGENQVTVDTPWNEEYEFQEDCEFEITPTRKPPFPKKIPSRRKK